MPERRVKMEFFNENLSHVLCVLLLVGRLGDIVSTYIATPNLKLEANPIIRKFKFRFAFMTSLICLVPYWDQGMGVVLIVASYLISFMNISKLWFLKTLGEDRAFKLHIFIAQQSSMWVPVLISSIAYSFLAGIGVLCIVFYPQTHEWAFNFGVGFLTFAVAIQIHTIFYFKRIFRVAKNERYKLIIERA